MLLLLLLASVVLMVITMMILVAGSSSWLISQPVGVSAQAHATNSRRQLLKCVVDERT